MINVVHRNQSTGSAPPAGTARGPAGDTAVTEPEQCHRWTPGCTGIRTTPHPSRYARAFHQAPARTLIGFCTPEVHPALPERADQIRNRIRRGSRGGHPPAFDKQLYKQRNVVERCFNRLKQWRGITMGYDKTAESYQAAVTLASLLMWA
ncbi:transposase [Streptomyces sp. ID38640]|nr:transposase [Streptomyces sp. ID38640]